MVELFEVLVIIGFILLLLKLPAPNRNDTPAEDIPPVQTDAPMPTEKPATMPPLTPQLKAILKRSKSGMSPEKIAQSCNWSLAFVENQIKELEKRGLI